MAGVYLVLGDLEGDEENLYIGKAAVHKPQIFGRSCLAPTNRQHILDAWQQTPGRQQPFTVTAPVGNIEDTQRIDGVISP